MNVIHKSLLSDIYELKSTRNNITMSSTRLYILEKMIKRYETYYNK